MCVFKSLAEPLEVPQETLGFPRSLLGNWDQTSYSSNISLLRPFQRSQIKSQTFLTTFVQKWQNPIYCTPGRNPPQYLNYKKNQILNILSKTLYQKAHEKTGYKDESFQDP